MNIQLHHLLLFFTILIIVGNLNAQSRSRADHIDSLLQVAHRRGFFNGNALVAEKGKIVYQKGIGFADARQKEKLSAELRFGIGSISKEFDGTAIMLLKEQGKLALNDRLSEYFPDLPAWTNNITVRNLLQYTSGLPAPDYRQVRTDAENMEYLQNLSHLQFEPGTDYNYNNTDVFLRKRIVEMVSGKRYADFLNEHMLAPCGLKSAVIDPTEITPQMAHSFDNRFKQDDFNNYQSGWLYLTSNDLYRWSQCLHSGRLINRDALLELFESFSQNSQSPLGRGFFEEGELKFQYHHGQNDNFEASLYVNVQDDYTVILLTNNRNSNVGDLTMAIDAILRGNPFEIPKKSIEMTIRTEIWYHGFDRGMQVLESIQKNKREIYDFEHEERELINTAEYLIEKERIDDGLKVLEYTSTRFPESWKAYAALGEAYLQLGDRSRARLHLNRALKLNPEEFTEEAYRELMHKD